MSDAAKAQLANVMRHARKAKAPCDCESLHMLVDFIVPQADLDFVRETMPEIHWERLNGFEVCTCGDYRHQHRDGKGACLLGSRCTPYPSCQRFEEP